MKKLSKFIITLSLAFSIFSAGISHQITFAAGEPTSTTTGAEDKTTAKPDAPTTPASGGTKDGTGSNVTPFGANPTVNNLLPSFTYTSGTGKDAKEIKGIKDSKIGYVNALPKKSWQEAITGIIRILLNITGGLTLLGLTLGGTFMVTAGGKPDVIEKGKKIVIYSIYGLIVIAISYALVIGVSELKFFTQ